MSDHDHHHHDHAAPEGAPLDAGSRALEEALRSSFVIVKAVMFVLLVVFIFSGMKTVAPQEKAVILRFGKPLGAGAEQLLGPGLHWAWPYPIDEVVTVPVTESHKLVSTVGWFATSGIADALDAQPPQQPTLNPANDGYVICGDGNIIHARATLRYRITDPIVYVFNFVGVTNILQDVLNNALLYAAAHTTVDKAVVNDASFKEKIFSRVNEQIASLNLGITLEPGDVQVAVPGFVQPDFKAVTDAGQELSQKKSAAEGYASTNLLAAQAEANGIVNTARAEANAYVSELAAAANVFTNQLAQYSSSPDLFRQRRLTETWQRVLARAADKFISLEAVKEGQTELRLQINREPTKSKTNP